MRLVAERCLSGLICLGSALLTCGLTALLIAPERAVAEAEPLVICTTGIHTIVWSPGLANDNRLVTVSARSYWGACVSRDSDLAVSASSEQRFQATFSCQALRTLASPITWVIRWNDRVTSTYTFNASLEREEDKLTTLLVGTGSIVDGRYKGAKAMTVFVLGNLDSKVSNECASASGLTQLKGPSMLIISP
ncbi:hypothetical protein [Pseudomonas sp. CDFA 610]|uniref:hypothetical protein n=1 Tax=Pseudomonas sp. CDFA 610 TaxID=2829825 RepID=UPI001E5A1412|nr:hypothetical protein [Pseudomonas sp. CDFA 610]MCD5984420.1 hypothetical protein [Pseudomonas sp. CDFA 610]